VTEALFRSPLLAGLDARGRADVQAVARVRHLAQGDVAFAAGEPADTLWFVVSGSVVVETPHGSRELGPSQYFGHEALVRGARRTGQSRARRPSSLLEVPVVALERIVARTGAAALLVRESAAARRHALSALLQTTPFGQALGEPALDALVTRLREQPLARGSRLFDAEERATAAYVVASGLVELVTASGDKGYAARGDLVGLEATLAEGMYGSTASALGDAVAWAVSSAVARELAVTHPRAMALAESAARARFAQQRKVEQVVRGLATRHAFHELERLDSASSLLAIELDRCVRCGECTRACADTHGTPRLERRGDKAVLALTTDGDAAPRALLLPRACQHCKDPACLPECPTGAITRDASGAVDVNQDLCTGCGACAKACPWDAIRLAPRVAGETGGSALVASKCDLCRGKTGPACVEACPTGALFRADPERQLAELGSVLGRARRQPAPRPARGGAARLVAYAALVPPCVALAATGGSARTERHLLVTGALAGVGCVLLLGHGLLKRFPRARAWLSKRVAWGEGRGAVPFVRVHQIVGFLTAAAVLAHVGLVPLQGAAGALTLGFWGLALSGGLGAAAYRVLPARLTRLERRGSLPEDHAAEREALEQRLYGSLTAQDTAAKELARRVLLPYARAVHGPFVLVASGRTLGEEERALAAEVARLVGGRRSARLASVGELVQAAVELRALGARRVLEAALGAWLPLHVVLSALFAALLVVHVVGALR
jgi:Fe-S-cluster-containing dehydrogenase component/CRP-like cAMP-binding protein